MWLRFIKLLSLLLMSTLFGHRGNAKDICLYAEFSYAGMLGVTHFPSGAYSEITYSSVFPTPESGAMSPDGTKLAVVDDFEENAGPLTPSRPVHVSVKTFPAPNIYGDPLLYNNNTLEDPKIQVSWSPDSHLIAYHWQVGKEHFLGLSDANGKLLKWTDFKVSQDVVIHLNGWSADGEYLALIQIPSNEWTGFHHNVTLSFISIPNLTHLNLDMSGLNSSSSCAALYTVVDTCAVWSPIGHRVAYVVSDTKPFQVVLMTPGTKETHHFDVQFSQRVQPLGIYLRWSPDARYIAATALSEVGQDNPGPLRDAQLDIFGMDGSAQQNIASVAMENIATVGYEPDMTNKVEWTADSKSIVYVREPQSPQLADVHIYNLATKTSTLLYEVQQAHELYVFPSPDGKSVAVDQFADGEDLFNALLIAQDGSRMLKLPPASQYTKFLWEPDQSVLAVVDNLNGNVVQFWTSEGQLLFAKTIPQRNEAMQFAGTAFWGSCDQPYTRPS